MAALRPRNGRTLPIRRANAVRLGDRRRCRANVARRSPLTQRGPRDEIPSGGGTHGLTLLGLRASACLERGIFVSAVFLRHGHGADADGLSSLGSRRRERSPTREAHSDRLVVLDARPAHGEAGAAGRGADGEHRPPEGRIENEGFEIDAFGHAGHLRGRAMVRRTHCPSRGNRSGASADNRILTDLGARCRDVGPRRQDRGLRVRCRWDNPASTSGRTTMARDHEWNVAGPCRRLQVT